MILLLFLLSYLIGSFPTAYVLSKSIARKNILDLGDKNVGARNAFHSVGKKVGLLTFVLDGLKGYLVFLISFRYKLPVSLFFLSAFFGWIGHCYPIWLRFKGGKGVAFIIGFLLPQHLLSAILSAVIFFPIKNWIKDFDWSYSFTVAIFLALLFFEKVSFLYFVLCVLLFLLPLIKTFLFSVRKW